MKYKKGILYETRRTYYDDIYFYKGCLSVWTPYAGMSIISIFRYIDFQIL